MSDTEKKATTPTQRKRPTQKAEPEKSTRDLLIERVKNDLLFKKDLSDEQIETLQWTKTHIEAFREGIENLIEFSPIKKRLIDTDEYRYGYLISIRESHRWANTAIANDWTKESDFDRDIASGLEYPEEADIRSEQQRLCYEISRRCYELTTLLVTHLPEGRALSLFATEMQNTRGWLLDTVNLNL